MRIRSIRPEFWSSEDIASLTWEQRLIYIGLWSYVDDNGVGRDIPKLIAADLFPLEDKTPLTEIQGALTEYSNRKMITRYTVGGKPYLHINAWDEHQKINRPSAGRYPLPTREDASIIEGSVSPLVNAPLGEGEKGRRGEGEKKKIPSSNAAAFDAEFDRFWALYPRKVGKGQARGAYRKARSKVTVEQIAAALHVYIRASASMERDKVRHPATWLNGEPWEDDPAAIAPEPRPLKAVGDWMNS